MIARAPFQFLAKKYPNSGSPPPTGHTTSYRRLSMSFSNPRFCTKARAASLVQSCINARLLLALTSLIFLGVVCPENIDLASLEAEVVSGEHEDIEIKRIKLESGGKTVEAVGKTASVRFLYGETHPSRVSIAIKNTSDSPLHIPISGLRISQGKRNENEKDWAQREIDGVHSGMYLDRRIEVEFDEKDRELILDETLELLPSENRYLCIHFAYTPGAGGLLEVPIQTKNPDKVIMNRFKVRD